MSYFQLYVWKFSIVILKNTLKYDIFDNKNLPYSSECFIAFKKAAWHFNHSFSLLLYSISSWRSFFNALEIIFVTFTFHILGNDLQQYRRQQSDDWYVCINLKVASINYTSKLYSKKLYKQYASLCSTNIHKYLLRWR